MPNEQSEDFVRIYKYAVAINSADAIAVAIDTECRIVFSGADCLPGGFDVRLDGLGVNAGKARIAHSANFIARNIIASEQLAEQASRGTVHGVAQEAEFRVP